MASTARVRGAVFCLGLGAVAVSVPLLCALPFWSSTVWSLYSYPALGSLGLCQTFEVDFGTKAAELTNVVLALLTGGVGLVTCSALPAAAAYRSLRGSIIRRALARLPREQVAAVLVEFDDDTGRDLHKLLRPLARALESPSGELVPVVAPAGTGREITG